MKYFSLIDEKHSHKPYASCDSCVLLLPDLGSGGVFDTYWGATCPPWGILTICCPGTWLVVFIQEAVKLPSPALDGVNDTISTHRIRKELYRKGWRADLALFKKTFHWLSWKSQKIDSPEGVLRYFSLGLFEEPKWFFSQCVCNLTASTTVKSCNWSCFFLNIIVITMSHQKVRVLITFRSLHKVDLKGHFKHDGFRWNLNTLQTC